MSPHLAGEARCEAAHGGGELGWVRGGGMTGAPLAKGVTVIGDEHSAVHAERDAVDLGIPLLAATDNRRIGEAVDLRIGYASLDVVGEPSVLGCVELVDGDETIAIVAAATPLLNAVSSMGRSSGTS